MKSAPNRRALGPIAALAVVFFALMACGGDSAPTDVEQPPPPPPPPPPPTVQGQAIYAVDLSNRLLLFGSGNADTVAMIVPIRGVSILDRIVGVDFRPSTGELYGVGNDSRVYIIDTQTGQATPVSSTPFEPKIASFFEIHFGMAFDPVTERIHLVSAEGGLNWSIDPDDGTAVMGPAMEVAAGDPHEGATLHLSGLAAVPPGLSPSGLAVASASSGICDAVNSLFIGISADLGALFNTCDPDLSEWETLGDLPFALIRCADVKLAFDDEEGPVLRASMVVDGEQRVFQADLFDLLEAGLGSEPTGVASAAADTLEMTLLGTLPVDSPIQAIGMLSGSGSGSSPVVRADRASDIGTSLSRAPGSPDLAAQCTGAGN